LTRRIELNGQRFASTFLDERDGLGRVKCIGDDDVGALLRESHATCSADPVRASGDDRDPTI
jgi:streptomycin 6-kinase